jgi:16S rRNA (guanine527-N7)-methyltransferase
MVRDPERLTGRMPWSSLSPLIPGADADRWSVLERLRAFAVELLKWNQGISNLISHDDEPRLVERHIAESLAGVEVINSLGCKELVDFGSGGGFPAIPLMLAGVGSRWTLVESRRNKTLFLRRAVQELQLTGVSVITGRLEVLVEEDPERLRCDGFTSRATNRLGPTLELAARILVPGGHAVLWKGSGIHEELVASTAEISANWGEPQLHPIGEGPNSIVVLRRKAND